VNLIGEEATVISAADPTMKGRKGTVVLETANTLLIDSGPKRFTVQKKGTTLRLARTGSVVRGDQVNGRLEDRLGARKK
jgi:RNase P/RNase MRP subunit p29